MISHHDKCVFVHIPKCAGQSIEVFFLNRIGLDWKQRAPLLLRLNEVPELGPPRLAHLKAREYVENKWMTPAQFDDYFKFSFVRNPWDRIASFYRHLGYDWRCSFPHFVMKHLPKRAEERPWFLCPQTEFTHDADGRQIVDFVGRFEALERDFAVACERIGLPASKLPHVNDSKRPVFALKRWLKRRPLPYRELYDAHSRKIVADMYRSDIETFGYGF